jgi:hypothetical protein
MRAFPARRVPDVYLSPGLEGRLDIRTLPNKRTLRIDVSDDILRRHPSKPAMPARRSPCTRWFPSRSHTSPKPSSTVDWIVHVLLDSHGLPADRNSLLPWAAGVATGAFEAPLAQYAQFDNGLAAAQSAQARSHANS